MADQQTDTPAQTAPGWVETATSAPRPATGTDRQSVPDAPPNRDSRTRVLGPGSMAGTLCADPDMRFSQNGKAIVKLRLAVADRVKDEATGQWADGPTQFHDITVWGKQGENAVESLKKGDRVLVNGMWQEDAWVGRDEQWHVRRTMNARDVGPSLMFKQARVVRGQEEK